MKSISRPLKNHFVTTHVPHFCKITEVIGNGSIYLIHYVYVASALHCIKGCFTLWPKVMMSLISTTQIARNQEFGLSHFTLEAKIQRPLEFKMPTWK